MPLNICPAALVAAPIETIWDMLTTPARYGEWLDATVERIEPEGPLCPGQVIFLTTKELGKSWPVTFSVKNVDADKHSLDLHVTLPLGMANKEHLSCTRVDSTTTRVQFG